MENWGQADLSDKIRSGRPVTASDQLHQDRIAELIRGNRRINKKKLPLPQEFLRREWDTLLVFLNSEKFVPDGDKSRPHTSAATRDAIQHLKFSVLLHPPYSPDLAPSNFHLFPNLKEHLKGQCFSCDEEVKSAVRKWFQKQNTNFFKGEFQKLVQRWRK